MLTAMGRVAALLLLSVAVAACGATDSGPVVGDGVPGERTVDVINFDRIDVAFEGSVTLVPGEQGAMVRGDANVVDLVGVEVRNRVLVIDLDESVETVLPLEVEVSFGELAAVELSGEGSLMINGWRTQSAELVLSGAGNVEADVTVRDLVVRYPGAGSITITGEAGSHRVDKDGLGPYRAGDLRTDITEVVARGIGEIEVWAELELRYDVTGQGALKYWGEPTTDGEISSQGGLVSLGPKES